MAVAAIHRCQRFIAHKAVPLPPLIPLVIDPYDNSLHIDVDPSSTKQVDKSTIADACQHLG